MGLRSVRKTSSRLQEPSFLFYRHGEKHLIPFFEMDDDFVDCADGEGLLSAMVVSTVQTSEGCSLTNQI